MCGELRARPYVGENDGSNGDDETRRIFDVAGNFPSALGHHGGNRYQLDGQK